MGQIEGGSNIIDNGLVFILDIADLNCYPGSGTTSRDMSSSQRVGTLTNGPTFSSSNGGSLVYDGVNDYVTHTSATGATNSFTTEIWCLPNNSIGIQTQSTTGADGTVNQRYVTRPVFRADPNSGTGISIGTNGVGVYEHAGGYMPPLLFHVTPIYEISQIVVVYTNKQPSLYINGVFIKNGLTSPRTIVALMISWIGGGDYGYFSGNIYSVKMYNRALTAVEIKNNFDVFSTRLPNVLPFNFVTSGLTSNLDASNTSSYSGTGTAWTDLSGNNNGATLTNGPTFSSANSGQIVLDGSNDFIDFGNKFNFTTENFTFSLWVYPKSFSSNNFLIYKGNQSSNGYYMLIATDSSLQFFTNQSGAWQGSSVNGGLLTINTWWNIVIVRNGSSVRFFINGIDRTNTSGTHINPASSSTNFTIGNYSNGSFANSNIASFLVYTRALSGSEIYQNFAFKKSLFGL
jgi:hypothetical protein